MTATLMPRVATKTDVGYVVAGVARAVEGLAAERRVRLAVESAPDCTTEVSASVLERVLADFVADAIQASEWRESVVVRTHAVGDDVHVDIITSGAGARSRGGRILEPYMRKPSLLRSARLELEAAGGRLRTTSDLGRCTTFTVIVPKATG